MVIEIVKKFKSEIQEIKDYDEWDLRKNNFQDWDTIFNNFENFLHSFKED